MYFVMNLAILEKIIYLLICFFFLKPFKILNNEIPNKQILSFSREAAPPFDRCTGSQH